MTERTSKKIGAWIPPDLYTKLINMGYLGGQVTQTDTIIRALNLLVDGAEDKTIWGNSGCVGDNGGHEAELELVKARSQIIEDTQKITVLEARLNESEAHRATLIMELEQVHEEFRAHLGQVQTLLMAEEKRRLLEDSGKKKVWWKFW